jgi:N-methylhydantoinase A
LAKPLNISIEAAAMGVHRIVNENMANAARVHILEKGHDPRLYSMTAFGGAGPVHAFGVARLLGSPQLIVPVGSGVLSALGFLVSPVASESIRSYVCPVNMFDWTLLNRHMNDMEAEGLAFLESTRMSNSKSDTLMDGVEYPDQTGVESNLQSDLMAQRIYNPLASSTVRSTTTRMADMRYSGQGHEISVEIPNGTLSEKSLTEIEENFKKEYHLRYGKTIEDIDIEAVTWRVVVSGPTPEVIPKQIVPKSQNSAQALKGHRKVFLVGAKDYADVPVYGRYDLQPGDSFAGPAIIEEMECTFIVGANSVVLIDKFRNIVVEM